jgi:hypothetical protein
MRYTVAIISLVFSLTACVASGDHPTRDFCVDTACRSLENSGTHYQAQQQGYFITTNQLCNQ